jgi:hypothetical protein
VITIKIGASEQSYENADENWINQQINRRRRDSLLVCVQVAINNGYINMILSTPNCNGVGGGGRRPNVQEQRIFDLWDKQGLNKPEFHGGNLIAFLKQLRRIID